jgi:hypothetical protein
VANRRGIIVPSLVADKRGGVESSVGMLQGALSDAPAEAPPPVDEPELVAADK